MTTAQPAASRILLVEDEMLVRMFAADVLEEAGFGVEQAGDAAEALLKLREINGILRAAIVDLGLPDRAGDQLALELHGLRADLPIVIASGRSERELKDRFADSRNVAILVKPYTASMLVDALASLGVTRP